MTCSMYLDTDEFCDRLGVWRPANIPMTSDEWFCKQHAVFLARREGMYGVYHRDRRAFVEELDG